MQSKAIIELDDFVKKNQRECAASTARVDRVSARTGRRIAYGYRKLFPSSMLMLLFIGMADYKRRTNRYEQFTQLALAAQRRIGSAENE